MAAKGKAPAVIVIDVGKTRLKLLAIEPEGGSVLASFESSNQPRLDGPYHHLDSEAVWAWLLGALRCIAGRVTPLAIVPTAYGSTAALLDGEGLVLPILDYEAELPADIAAAYSREAPDFWACCCPINPASLTLGRQLFWQSRAFAKAFERVEAILPAPQYWAWRLTGIRASEVTSLGAQTQLWDPRRKAFSKLVAAQGWDKLLPPIRAAHETLGGLRPDIAKATGFEPDLPVLVGIHDSNANFARYLAAGLQAFTLVSSGTWIIAFDRYLPLERLDPTRDMVANTALNGQAIACTRFMGGREYALIAGEAGLAAAPTTIDLERLIARGTMALPSFTDSGGPFPATGKQGRIEGPPPSTPEERAALAALYVALMTHIDLDLLASKKLVIVDGSFAERPLFAGILAALRPRQNVMISKPVEGTALGASLLWGWAARKTSIPIDLEPAQALSIEGLDVYARRWTVLASDPKDQP